MTKKYKYPHVDNTVDPTMGCLGCEQFLSPMAICRQIDEEILRQNLPWKMGDAEEHLKMLIEHAPSYDGKFTTTNIFHARIALSDYLTGHFVDEFDYMPIYQIIERSATCFAARLHLKKGYCIGLDDPEPDINFAPIFEEITTFTGRVARTAQLKDLFDYRYDAEDIPWKKGLPRMILIGNMGDAFSRESEFDFLKNEVIPAIQSEDGRRHMWIWMTKRPDTMALFSEEIGGFPDNVCVMTSLSDHDAESLRRIEQLRQVKAVCRGIAFEPLREKIPSSCLNLSGIDWVIVAGESGKLRYVHPFDLEWATEIRDRCKKYHTAFFMKQLGRAPNWQGQPIALNDKHGEDWNEWPNDDLKIREFPDHFRTFRTLRKLKEALETIPPVVELCSESAT